MTQRDDNQIPVFAGVLNTDGATPTSPQIDASTHILQIENNITGSDFGNDVSVHDDNGIPTACATDISGNIIPLYTDSSGNLLVDSI